MRVRLSKPDTAGRLDVAALDGGGTNLALMPNAPVEWSTFDMWVRGGVLKHGAKVAFRAYNGQYWQAVKGGGEAILANLTWAKGYETFRIEREQGAGPAQSGEQIAIRTYHGKYVDGSMKATAASFADAAKFALTIVDDSLPLNVLVLGDSIMWGQGLEQKEKFTYLLKEWLEQELDRAVNLFVYAHSGATIESYSKPHDEKIKSGKMQPLYGEVNVSFPSIGTQATMAAGQLDSWHWITPDQVDLILLDGGINDVGLETILLPRTGVTTVIRETLAKAVKPMAELVPYLKEHFPNAKIAITNYFPILSRQSEGAQFLLDSVLGKIGDIIVHLRFNEMVAQCQAFARTYDKNVGDLVKGDDRVRFVKNGFGDGDAFGTKDSLLWSLSSSLSPEDPVARKRCAACDKNSWAPPKLINRTKCRCASAGHPNRAGALRYFERLRDAIAPWAADWKKA